MKVHVPSGIGDVSWIYSKLCHLDPMEWAVCDGWPHRTTPFLKLLPSVTNAEYGNFGYKDIIVFEEQHGIGVTPTIEHVNKQYAGFANIFLEANRHLEAGKRLEDWLPDLPTNFHYHIPIPEEDSLKAIALLAGMERPIWGISAASYRGSEAWKTWGYDEWSHFLRQWHTLAGGTILLMGGFWDDLTHTLSGIEGFRDIVGKTSVPSMIKVLDLIDGYIGFSSGMGILRTVLNKPVFMMWPDHQVELSTSWAPQRMLDEGSYVASLWREPRLVFERAKIWWRDNYAKLERDLEQPGNSGDHGGYSSSRESRGRMPWYD